jgi:hypothetical protein
MCIFSVIQNVIETKITENLNYKTKNNDNILNRFNLKKKRRTKLSFYFNRCLSGNHIHTSLLLIYYFIFTFTRPCGFQILEFTSSGSWFFR